jgi:ATP-dependent helicase HrpA
VPAAPGADRDRMRAVQELEALWRARLEAWPADRPLPPALHEARWLLEELRMAQFAQALGVKGQVSAKRIRALLA